MPPPVGVILALVADRSRFSLRVQGRQVELPQGEFRIGRNAACDLVLNDGMVSRHHASLRTDGDSLVVEDAGSRNGVRVNGMKLTSAKTLGHGDHVTVGSFEIVVFEEGHTSRERKSTQKLPLRGRRERHDTPRELGDDEETYDLDSRSVYDALVSSCERALADGKVQKVVASARNLQASVRGGMVQSQPPQDGTLRRLAEFALQAEEVTGERAWIECMFDVFGSARRVPDREHLDRLRRLAQARRLEGNEHVESYLHRMRSAVDQLGAQERRRLGEVEDLAGWARSA